MTSAALSPSTLRWLDASSAEHRKRLGQFMTPRPVRERLLDLLPLHPGMRVLDPGVGTGELLRSVLDREPEVEAHGWDVDESVLGAAAALVPEARLARRSALEHGACEPFDLVIGNPPYFQLRADPETRRRFADVISGRPNVFALFFKAGLDLLAPGGRLGFVVPPSMNNGAYFEALRAHLAARAEVEHLTVVDGHALFHGARTAVQLVVLRKGAGTGRHLFTRSCEGFRRTVLAADPQRLAAEFAGRRTLHELGYRAVTGTVVWNQRRGWLRRDPGTGTVPLVWAHNVRDGRVVLDPGRASRPQYVVPDRALTGPALVTNRVVGAVGAGSLRCALVPDGERFVAENHVNVVVARDGVVPVVGFPRLLEALRRPEVVSRVRLLTGNTQLSATELTHLVPVDCDLG